MLGFLRSPSKSAAGAIGYVTVGVLLVIWSCMWYYYFIRPDPNASAWARFLCFGIIFSGVAVSVIGLLFGMIGKGAKAADNTVGVAGTVPVAAAAPVVTNAPVAAPVVNTTRSPGNVSTLPMSTPMSTAVQ